LWVARNVEKIEPKARLAKRLRVAAYARVSRDGESMLRSFAAQVSYYSKHIQSNPEWEYVGVYADEALSGCNAERPEFQRLLADCRAGKVDLVLTKAVSRFARNTLTTLEVTRELKSLGIGVFFEEQGINTLSAEGEVMLTILASVAQDEARNVSENIKWTHRKKCEQGNPIIGGKIYGYDRANGKLIVNEKQAEIVREIFKLYHNGETSGTIVKKLNAREIPSPTDVKWCSSQICKVLSNEKYIGDYYSQKYYIENIFTKRCIKNNGELPRYYIEGVIPPIVDHKVWADVQEILKQKATRADYSEKPAPFAKMMFCGATGNMYSVRVSSSKYQYIWQCYRRKTKRNDNIIKANIPDYAVRECVTAALGLEEFDESIFKEKVEKILVTGELEITVIFKNGAESRQTWIPWPKRRGKEWLK
jgi:DNA invertase Pin-like site-specific DNA recombinase